MVFNKFFIGTCGILTTYQAYSIYNYGKFYNKVRELQFKGDQIISPNDMVELDYLTRNIGIFPFTLVSSIYYGTNRAVIDIKNGIPRLIFSHDKTFFDFVSKTYADYISHMENKNKYSNSDTNK